MPVYRATSQNPTTNISQQPPGNLAAAVFDSMYQTIWNVLNDSSNGYASLATDTGVVNNYVLTNNSPALAYRQGMLQAFLTANVNTGPAQINVDGLGNVAITTSAGAALSGGELLATGINLLLYDGTKFRMVFAKPVAAGGWACYNGSLACTTTAANVTNWTLIAANGLAITLDSHLTTFTVPGVSVVQVGGTTPVDLNTYQVSLSGTSGNTFGSTAIFSPGQRSGTPASVGFSMAGFQTAGSFSVQGLVYPVFPGPATGTLTLYISILTFPF